MIEVSLEKDSDGYLILTAYPPEISVSGKAVGRRFDLSKFKKRRRFTRWVSGVVVCCSHEWIQLVVV